MLALKRACLSRKISLFEAELRDTEGYERFRSRITTSLKTEIFKSNDKLKNSRTSNTYPFKFN